MKNREFRELQVSSTQLAIIFFGILIIGVVIFLLGVSVGKKHAQASLKTSVVAQKAPEQVKDKLIIPDTQASVPPVKEAPKEEPAAKKAQAPAKTEPPPVKTESSAPAKEPPQAPAEKPKSAAKTVAEKVAAPVETKKAQPRVETPPARTEAAPKKGLYYVQVGALAEKSEALTVSQKYRSQGYGVVVLDPLPTDKKTVFRVRVGGFATREEAESLRVKLVGAAGRRVDYFIVRD
jgi:cell division septation protein DedD